MTVAGDPVIEQSSMDPKERVVGYTEADGQIVLLDGERLWIGDARGRCIALVSKTTLAAIKEALDG